MDRSDVDKKTKVRERERWCVGVYGPLERQVPICGLALRNEENEGIATVTRADGGRVLRLGIPCFPA